MHGYHLVMIAQRWAILVLGCVISVALALFFGPTQEALSQTAERSVGMRIGGAVFTTSGRYSPQVEMDGAPALGLFAGVRRSRYSLELSADWIQTDFQRLIATTVSAGSVSRTTYELVKGELNTIPIQLTGRVHLFKEGRAVDPYLGVGGGYYINMLHVTESQGTDVSIDDAFGAQVGLGTNIRVSPVLAITVDGRYLFSRADVTYKGSFGLADFLQDTLDYNGFVATVGVKYTFPR